MYAILMDVANVVYDDELVERWSAGLKIKGLSGLTFGAFVTFTAKRLSFRNNKSLFPSQLTCTNNNAKITRITCQFNIKTVHPFDFRMPPAISKSHLSAPYRFPMSSTSNFTTRTVLIHRFINLSNLSPFITHHPLPPTHTHTHVFRPPHSTSSRKINESE